LPCPAATRDSGNLWAGTVMNTARAQPIPQCSSAADLRGQGSALARSEGAADIRAANRLGPLGAGEPRRLSSKPSTDRATRSLSYPSPTLDIGG
jgi:hypothetical protein